MDTQKLEGSYVTHFFKRGSKEQFRNYREPQISKSDISRSVKTIMKNIPLAKVRIIEHLEEHD